MSIKQNDSLQPNILVVDDNVESLHLLTKMLSSAGYRTRVSIKGLLALNAIQLNLPNLILLDIMMPDIDGYEVCKRLKADARTRHIPVIFISALQETFDKVKAFSVGAVDYITKPFQIEEVLARIETQLRLQSLQNQLVKQNARMKQEICDRQRAETEIIRSKDLLESIFNESADAIFLVNYDTNLIAECNQRAVELFEAKSKEELLNIQGHTLQKKGFTPLEVESIFSDLELYGVWSRELEYITKRGKVFWGNLAVKPIAVAGQKMNLVRVTDITKRKQRDESLRLIVAGTAAQTGSEFFRSCVRYLASALHVRYAVIAEFTDEAKTTARTLAFWQGETWGENWEYKLENTPYQNVVESQLTCYYPENLPALFPDAPDFIKLNAQSYLGIPLINSSGKILGFLAVLDVKPMEPDPEQESILKIFAARAGAELERQQVEEALIESEKRLSQIINTNADGLIVIDRQGIVCFVNSACESLFGRGSEQLLGQWFEVPVAVGGIAEVQFSHPTRGVIVTEVRLVEIVWEGDNAYLASLRDITDRKQAENEIRLLLETTQAISRAEDVSSAFTVILRLICTTIGWDVGEAWIPADDRAVLEYGSGWYGGQISLEQFRRCSETVTFTTAAGLPGRVWQSRQPEWLEDVCAVPSSLGIFSQTQIAAKVGLKACFGVPILASNQVLAVLVFLKRASSAEDRRLLALVSAIAAQLGWLIERKQAELALQKSEQRFRAIFNSMFQFIGLLQPDGTVLEVNQTALAFVGSEHEDAIGRPFWEVLWWTKSPETQHQLQDAIARAAKGEFVRYEVDIVGSNSLAIAIDFSLKPVFDDTGEVILLIPEGRDISDRKALERELALREARLNAFFKCAPVGLAITDNQLRFVQINEPLALINGKSVQDHIGKTLREVVPQLAPTLEPLYQQVLTTGKPTLNVEISGEVPSQPGIGRDWVISQFPILKADGSPEGLGVVVMEITERKRAESALRSVTERLQHLLTSSPAVIYSCKPSGDYGATFISENVAAILGYEAREFTENSSFWASRIHPEDAERVFGELRQLFEKGSHSHEYRFLHKDGTYRWFYDQLRVIKDSFGNPTELVGYWLDISDRKQVEEALRESAQRERAIARTIQRMRQTLDMKTIFAATTEELRQLISCDRVVVYRFNTDWSGEFVSESVGSGWIPLVQQQKHNSNLGGNFVEEFRCPVKSLGSPQALVQDTYLQETQGGAYSRGASHLAVCDIYKAGFEPCYINLLEQFQAKAYITVPIFSGNQLWGLLAAYQNSSSRQWRAAEINVVVQIGAQLGVALQQAELLSRTQRQSKALQQAVVAADAANRAKSEFLANMSHELRTPLNAILGFTQVMSRDSSLSAEQQEHLEIINRAGSYLLELINDILEVSKIEAGRTTLNESSFSLILLLDSLEKMLRLKAVAKGLQLQFEYAPNIPQYVRTDESKLRQVLINLLGNAIKFTETGKVALRVGLLENGEIERLRNGQVNATHLVFEVEDTGPGIASEEINLLFEAFEQTETGRKSQQGTGLGLPISRKYVQLMGGDIKVSSILGQGSVFVFDIQIGCANASEIQTTQNQRQVIGLAPDQLEYRILVVDDIRESRLLLVRLFTSIGFSVREAENGREAVALWESWSPHLIFMDMRMPVMDGYEAAKQIKAKELLVIGGESSAQNQKQRKTAIVALTANAFEEDREASLSAGCDDFVCKPFQEAVLLEKIEQFLGVRYIYAEKTPHLEEQRQLDEKSAIAADWQQYFSQMPAEWISELYEAACECSDDRVFELIEQIPLENAALASALKNLANNFQFDIILESTQQHQESTIPLLLDNPTLPNAGEIDAI